MGGAVMMRGGGGEKENENLNPLNSHRPYQTVGNFSYITQIFVHFGDVLKFNIWWGVGEFIDIV